MLAITLSAITIAIAWVVFRPIIGISLLLIAVAALWLVKSKLKLARTRKKSDVGSPVNG